MNIKTVHEIVRQYGLGALFAISLICLFILSALSKTQVNSFSMLALIALIIGLAAIHKLYFDNKPDLLTRGFGLVILAPTYFIAIAVALGMGLNSVVPGVTNSIAEKFGLIPSEHNDFSPIFFGNPETYDESRKTWNTIFNDKNNYVAPYENVKCDEIALLYFIDIDAQLGVRAWKNAASIHHEKDGFIRSIAFG